MIQHNHDYVNGLQEYKSTWYRKTSGTLRAQLSTSA